jgi:uncharacterized membrane protein YidH (DUF202 family)
MECLPRRKGKTEILFHAAQVKSSLTLIISTFHQIAEWRASLHFIFETTRRSRSSSRERTKTAVLLLCLSQGAMLLKGSVPRRTRSQGSIRRGNFVPCTVILYMTAHNSFVFCREFCTLLHGILYVFAK